MASVWVAMSGGVDSSVAAARLVREGHRVTGVTMQLLPEGDEPGRCCSVDAVHAARRVCDLIGIEHYTLNMRDVFEAHVIEPFVRAYASGLTPNPCIACNDRLKFALLLARARTHGAEALATGHYARIVSDEVGRFWLHRARDPAKDQSYFLYRLTEPAIESVWFPLGDTTKAEVRAEARSLGLPTAERPESQEVCFVPQDAGSFVAARVPSAGSPGPILDEHGERVGTHGGIGRYTIGQRKGLGVAGGPWFVSEIRPATNTVVVAHGAPVPVISIALEDVVWRDAACARVDAVVRYRSDRIPASITPTSDGGALVELDLPVAGVAPGQAVVCYTGDRVVGGGVVRATR
ncbi:MAG: tRNA 2-thiouridine(34) synthase MnmA [Anaerosomatales bacterium]